MNYSCLQLFQFITIFLLSHWPCHKTFKICFKVWPVCFCKMFGCRVMFFFVGTLQVLGFCYFFSFVCKYLFWTYNCIRGDDFFHFFNSSWQKSFGNSWRPCKGPKKFFWHFYPSTEYICVRFFFYSCLQLFQFITIFLLSYWPDQKSFKICFKVWPVCL